MPKFEKNIAKSHEKEFQKAKILFSDRKYAKAEKLLLKNYHYYKSKNNLLKAYEALEKYIICLTKMGYHQKALPKVDEFLNYSKKINNENYKALAYGTKGIIIKNMGDFETAIELIDKAKNLFIKLANHKDLIKSFVNLGNISYFQGNYEQAINYYENGEKLSIEHNILSELSGIYQKMSFSYLVLNDIDTFHKCNEKIFENLDYITDPDMQTELMNQICSPTFYREEIGENLYQFLLDLLKDCRKRNANSQIVHTLRNLAGICLFQEKFRESKIYFDQALEISEIFNFEIDKAYIYNNIAELEFRENNLNKAIEHLKSSIKISKKANIVPLIIESYKHLGKIYKILNFYERSYHNYREALDYYLKIAEEISSFEQKERFRDVYQQLPTIIEELNKLIVSKDIEVELEELIIIQSISKKVCSTANQQFNNFMQDECRQGYQELEKTIKELMQEKLEVDTRQLFRIKDKYKIESIGKNFTLEPEEIELLYDKKCMKEKASKAAEIDVYGVKKNNFTYLLGECTFRAEPKITHKIKCFFTKASILSKSLTVYCEKIHQTKPKFHLIFISMQGFPDDIHLKQMKEEFLSIAPSRIVDIEYIGAEYYIRLLKDHDIPVAKYQTYITRLSDIK